MPSVLKYQESMLLKFDEMWKDFLMKLVYRINSDVEKSYDTRIRMKNAVQAIINDNVNGISSQTFPSLKFIKLPQKKILFDQKACNLESGNSDNIVFNSITSNILKKR